MSQTKLAIISLTVLLVLTIYFVLVYDWFVTNPWFNVVLHFLGGFFVTMLIYSFYHNEFSKVSVFFQFIALVGITLTIGVLWEFTEYIANHTLAIPASNFFEKKISFMGDLDDTIGDLYMDFVGAFMFWVLHFLWRRKSQKRQPLF